MPESDTCVVVARVELETVRLPACWPALDGEKAICAAQLAPTASAEGHVVEATWNWLEVESVSPASVRVPLLVSMTFCAALVPPTPVAAKERDAGCACTEPAAPPIPVREAVAAMTNAVELTVSAPVTTPLAVGVKTTPVEQLAPEASDALQVFWTRLKGGPSESARPLAAALFVFVTITVWAALA